MKSLSSSFHLQDKSFFVKPIEVGNEFEGIIALQAQLYGVATHEFTVCCIYYPFEKLFV